MKVLEIINSSRIAGTERHLLLLLKHVDRSAARIEVALFQDGPLAEHAREMGYPVRIFKGNALRRGVGLFRYMQERGFDVVHTHSGNFANGIARLCGVSRVIATVHGIGLTDEQLAGMGRIARILFRFKYRLSDALITVCRFDACTLMERFGVEVARLFNVYNGIEAGDPPDAPAARQRLLAELGLPENVRVIGTVARLSPQKGITYLLQAFARIRTELPDAHLVIMGDGELRTALETEASVLGIAERTTFTGYRTDADILMGGFDVFVLPSVWEGLPYSILEAMRNGLPVIASSIFGIPEMVGDENGILVKPRDCGELAEAIRRLYADPELLERLGSAGRRIVERTFDAGTMAEEILAVYENRRLRAHSVETGDGE